VFLRDLGPTEVGGFGISRADDPLLVDDFCLVGQSCTGMSVHFDDSSVADYFDSQVDQGRTPEQFARIWIHTHPGSSPMPSSTDEATFFRCFGAADWSVMFILACGGRTYARLHLRAGPGGNLLLPIELDFTQPFPGASPAAWETEYGDNVSWGSGRIESPPPSSPCVPRNELCELTEPWFEDPHFRPLAAPLSWEVLDG